MSAQVTSLSSNKPPESFTICLKSQRISLLFSWSQESPLVSLVTLIEFAAPDSEEVVDKSRILHGRTSFTGKRECCVA